MQDYNFNYKGIIRMQASSHVQIFSRPRHLDVLIKLMKVHKKYHSSADADDLWAKCMDFLSQHIFGQQIKMKKIFTTTTIIVLRF
jgi:hypothetical protein